MLALQTKASPSPIKEKSPVVKHDHVKKPAATPLANYIHDMLDNGNIPSKDRQQNLPPLEIKN